MELLESNEGKICPRKNTYIYHFMKDLDMDLLKKGGEGGSHVSY